ncbi:hypothetical protein HYS11_01145 [Candidatus Gottesmanbacteria bacterium]|nr:hypothetical protein [Candidatus Gottesmanbacteria bacterium]
MDQQHPATLNSHNPLLHRFDGGGQTTIPMLPVLIGGIILIIGGIVTGYALVKPETASTASSPGAKNAPKGKLFGAPTEKVFPDQATGKLEQGGIDGEGTHKLIRPGGDSQTIYLTSSILDLNQFTDKNVRLWGETFAAKKAGWFMDVGRVELLE